ncbi:MFS transporter [Nonomuraea sp. B5E05]|uniref:MFS transporter n=1 Tax=Nonomuraea sp. B5E05 TaxID=3153569 RepID=UPI00326145F8
MAHPRRWWILGVLCLALLVLSVDNMILTLSIPALMRELGASPADVQWILDAYILVFAGLLITAGSLSDRYGRRRLLIIGLVVLALTGEGAWRRGGIACPFETFRVPPLARDAPEGRSLRDLFNDRLDVMSDCGNEQLGTEPAAETLDLRPRDGETGAPERSMTIADGSGTAQRTASSKQMAVTA